MPNPRRWCLVAAAFTLAACSSNAQLASVADTLTPEQKAQRIQIRLEDLPPGYQPVEHPWDDDEICTGIPDVTSALPPVGHASSAFGDDHLVFSATAIYEDAAEAIAAFDYLEQAYADCNGGVITAQDGSETIVETERLEPSSIRDVDRIGGVAILWTTEVSGTFAESHIAVIDSTLLMAASTDPTVVSDLMLALANRLRDQAAASATVTPAAALDSFPGFGSVAFYSWPDGPTQLRALTFSNPDAERWLEASPDDRVDGLASAACVMTQGLELGQSLNKVDTDILDLFSGAERAQYQPDALGEVFGSALATYCPGLFSYLEQVIDSQQ